MPIAGALNLIGADALYGRYWGCDRGGAAPPFRALLLSGDRRRDRARAAAGRGGRAGRRTSSRAATGRCRPGRRIISPIPASATRSPTISTPSARRCSHEISDARDDDAVQEGLSLRLGEACTADDRAPMLRACPSGISGDAAMIKCLSAVALLASVSGAAFAAPRDRTRRRRFTRPRPVLPRSRRPIPQISPDGSWIAYVRRSGDIMTDRFRPTIWLIDTRTGQQMPLVAGPGAHSQPRWSPNGDRLAYVSTAEGGRAAIVRALDGERRGGADHRPARFAEQHRLVARRPADRLHDVRPRRGHEARRAAAKPEGAKWAEPLEIITAVTYRADGAGYLRARLRAHLPGLRPTAARRAS